MFILSTYTFISCLERQIVSWPRQGSQNFMQKPKLMENQHEIQEEVLDFHGIGVVHAKGSLEVSPCPPPNLFSTVPLACAPCGGRVPRGWWGAVPGGGLPATVVRGV